MIKQSIHTIIKQIDNEDITIEEKLNKLKTLVSNQYTENYKKKLYIQKLQNCRTDYRKSITKELLLNILNNTDISDNEYVLMYLCNNMVLSNFECLIKKVSNDYVLTETDKINKNQFVYKNTDKNCYTLILNNYDRFGYGTIRIDITDARMYKILDNIDMNCYIVKDKHNDIIETKRKLNTYRLSVYKKYTKKEVGCLLVKKLMDRQKHTINKIDSDIRLVEVV